MRVSLDRSMCVGHAQCATICPTVFGSDERGYAVLVSGGEVPSGHEQGARSAVDSCPEQAISVVPTDDLPQ